MNDVAVKARVHTYAAWDGERVEKTEVVFPPVAVVDEVQSLFGMWWFRSEGYPVGKRFFSEALIGGEHEFST